MIYLTVGSSAVPFDRLIMETDRLVERGILKDVTAQIGCATYVPQHLKHFRFGTGDEHREALRNAEFIITHAGCATLDECLALRKKLVIVPRLAKCGEAPDDHQLDVGRLLAAKNMALCAEQVTDLSRLVCLVETWTPETRSKFHQPEIAEVINQFLDSIG
jgi:UDP-N-acetylglucosamine transferase subunit ALG13